MLLDTRLAAIREAHADEALFLRKVSTHRNARSSVWQPRAVKAGWWSLSVATARALEWYWPTLHFATVAEAIPALEALVRAAFGSFGVTSPLLGTPSIPRPQGHLERYRDRSHWPFRLRSVQPVRRLSLHGISIAV